MEALERDAAKVAKTMPKAANGIKQTGRAAGTASGNVQRMGVAFRSTVAPLIAAVAAVTALSRSLSVLAERESDTLVLARNLQNIGQGVEKLAELQAVADRLDLGTLFNSEDFNKGFALLTSFKSIGVDSYERVTKAAADLATITGTDLKSAQLQLAKALENPVEGMSALSRSGTTFTKTQKEFVKSLVESNQQLEAQAYILNIVEGQYKGAATAAASGYAGALDTLSKRWRDVNEQIGKVVQPAATAFLNALSGYLLTVTEELVKTAKALSVLSRWAQETAGFIEGLGEQFQIAAVKTYQFFERLSEVVGLESQFAGFGAAISENIDQITSAALRSIPIIGQYFSVLDALKTLRGGINKAGAIGGTDVDSNPMQGADLDMAGIREQQRWADLMKSFQITTPKKSGSSGGASKAAKEAEREAERVAETLRDRGQLLERLEAQVKIQKATAGFDKLEKEAALEILEINQRYSNLLKGETNELIKQATVLAQRKELELQKAEAQADRFAQAQSEFTAFYKKEQELNTELTKTEELLKGAYETVAGGLTSGIQGLIDGTKEWGDVLSDILGQLGSMFLQAGFNGLGAGLKIPGFAGGGYTGNGSRSGGVDGKGGFPAILHPQETVVDHTKAMGQYNAGNNSAGGEMASVPTFKLETTVINGVEYATVDQVAQMGATAVKNGAKQGEARVMNSLRNSRSARSRIGV